MLVYSDWKMYYLRAKTELIQCMSGVFAVCWTFPPLIWNILITCMVKNMFYIKIIISGTHWFRHNWNFYTRICETNFAQSAVWRSRYDQWNWKCWRIRFDWRSCRWIICLPRTKLRKVFSRPHLLEYHICAGKHVYCKNENSYDKVKVLWSEKCVAVDHNFMVLLKSTSNIKVSLSEVWSLKITKPQKRFSVRIKEFLHSIYAHCNSTGKRRNFDMVAADLKTLRNVDGTKKFNKDEWLTPSQIRSLFTNFVRFGNRNQPECPLVKIENLAEIKDDELQCTLEEMDSAEFHLAASDLSEDIITHF